MMHPRDCVSVLDHVESALEATCGALLTLQSIDAPSLMHEHGDVHRHVTEAISHLRQTIDELREAQTQGHTGLALCFVLARDRRESRRNSGPGQSSPRRTA
jgi:hypothetical protein